MKLSTLIYLSFLMSSVFIIMVFASGQTFGQRAAEKYPWGSAEWRQEVNKLSHAR